MEKINMILGEKRNISIEISDSENVPFTITESTWKLKSKDINAVVDKGDGAVSDHIIRVTLEPKQKGEYFLEVIYNIANEILISRVEVDVK